MVKTASQQTSGSKLFKDWRQETVWAQCDKVQSNKARCHPTSKLITPCLHAAVMMKAAAAGFNQLLSGVNLRWNYSNKVRDSPHASGRKSLALRGEMVCVGPSCRSPVSVTGCTLAAQLSPAVGGRCSDTSAGSAATLAVVHRNARPTTETGCCPPSGDLRGCPERISSLWFQK